MTEGRPIEDKAQQIARLLPRVLQRSRVPDRSDPLSLLLGAMAVLLERPESVLDTLETFYDPRYAPPDSLIYLAYWMDLESLIAPHQPPGLAWIRRPDWLEIVRGALSAGSGGGSADREDTWLGHLGRLRALVDDAVPLLKQRGTNRGLERFLERATGVQGFSVTESPDQPFHILIDCPVADSGQARRFVERVVELQKPAYLTYELRFLP